jgi:DedD protein
MTMNTNRMIELALVFFVSLLSFSIGTYVGKKYSDNQHRLAQLEPQNKDVALSDVVDHGTENTETTAQAHTEKTTTMSDADVAKIAEEFATEDETAVETVTASKPVTEITDSTIKAKPTLTTTAAVQKLKQDVPKIIPAKVDLNRDVASIAERAKTMGSAIYTVQVGAYPTATDATKMTDSLKARGYKASSVEAVVNGKTWYRVQVGMFDNLQSAQDHKKELMEQNKLASAIIQKIQK